MAPSVALLRAESSILLAYVEGLMGSLNGQGIGGVALTQVEKTPKNVLP